jgi:hypothetical protein
MILIYFDLYVFDSFVYTNDFLVTGDKYVE